MLHRSVTTFRWLRLADVLGSPGEDARCSLAYEKVLVRHQTAPFVDPYQDPRTLLLLHAGMTALTAAC